LETIWNGGTLSTAGGLVFQGTADGYFSAYHASSGKRLWRFNAGLGIIAAPISYAAGGKQYVSVLVGYGGSAAIWGKILNAGWKYGAQPRRLLTFGLDGKAVLPPGAPPDMIVHAVDDPAIEINEADIAAGSAMYMGCAPCHGLNLESAGSPGPDLRESQIALHLDDLWTVVHDGTLIERGMPRFDTLTREQVRQIHAYIRAGAREVLGTRKPAQDKAGASHL
jgi:quinohemoprotein ethanol dehydrogenase